MATYYRWEKSAVFYEKHEQDQTGGGTFKTLWKGNGFTTNSDGSFTLNNAEQVNLSIGETKYLSKGNCFSETLTSTRVTKINGVSGKPFITRQSNGTYFMDQEIDDNGSGGTITSFHLYWGLATKGDSIGYVYSTNSSAYPTNGQSGDYWYSSRTKITTITVPQIAMENEPITVNWTAFPGATSYILQRKADTDDDWVQVYSGDALTFTETAGAWETVQYRVWDSASAGTEYWATSENVPVISASAMVISGQDGYLGTLVNDVPYTVSTDTGNQIMVKITVNGAVIHDGPVTSGTSEIIPVQDLRTGDGNIVIEAVVQDTTGPVSAVRRWTYHKDKTTFSRSGSPAELSKGGEPIWPLTLAECVRVGKNLGGDLGHALELLTPFIANGAKVETGSYVGTGTYGAENPVVLNFSGDFYAFVIRENNEMPYESGLVIKGDSYFYVRANSAYQMILTSHDNWIEFYGNVTIGERQLNDSGITYNYLVFLK